MNDMARWLQRVSKDIPEKSIGDNRTKKIWWNDLQTVL